MLDVIKFSDKIYEDNVEIIDPIQYPHGISPRGRLYEVVGVENGKKFVKEIKSNTVVVGGAIKALENLMGIRARWNPGTISREKHTFLNDDTEAQTLCLFGVGNGGANNNAGSIIATNIRQIDLRAPIPMRFGANTNLPAGDANKYGLKCGPYPDDTGTDYRWYMKEFDSVPAIRTCWRNASKAGEVGTEITANISTLTDSTGIETFADIYITLNANDLPKMTTGGANETTFNEIGFYTATKGESDFTNIKLYSVVSFANRVTKHDTTLQYMYRLYSLC